MDGGQGRSNMNALLSEDFGCDGDWKDASRLFNTLARKHGGALTTAAKKHWRALLWGLMILKNPAIRDVFGLVSMPDTRGIIARPTTWASSFNTLLRAKWSSERPQFEQRALGLVAEVRGVMGVRDLYERALKRLHEHLARGACLSLGDSFDYLGSLADECTMLPVEIAHLLVCTEGVVHIDQDGRFPLPFQGRLSVESPELVGGNLLHRVVKMDFALKGPATVRGCRLCDIPKDRVLEYVRRNADAVGLDRVQTQSWFLQASANGPVAATPETVRDAVRETLLRAVVCTDIVPLPTSFAMLWPWIDMHRRTFGRDVVRLERLEYAARVGLTDEAVALRMDPRDIDRWGLEHPECAPVDACLQEPGAMKLVNLLRAEMEDDFVERVLAEFEVPVSVVQGTRSQGRRLRHLVEAHVALWGGAYMRALKREKN